MEVGGWPIPQLVWYKDDEPVRTAIHTENYNGFPNKYVPERRVELRQIDPIRHCIIFHRISESDAGLYTVVATNPLGEAVCQANFIIEPGEGGADGKPAFVHQWHLILVALNTSHSEYQWSMI